MALKHAQPGQPVDISPLGASLQAAATHAILKTRALELIRVVMRAGETMPQHQVRGEVTLLCIEGAVEVRLDGTCSILHAHQLVLLPARVPHALQALEDSSLLLTIQTPAGAPGSGSSTS